MAALLFFSATLTLWTILRAFPNQTMFEEYVVFLSARLPAPCLIAWLPLGNDNIKHKESAC